MNSMRKELESAINICSSDEEYALDDALDDALDGPNEDIREKLADDITEDKEDKEDKSEKKKPRKTKAKTAKHAKASGSRILSNIKNSDSSEYTIISNPVSTNPVKSTQSQTVSFSKSCEYVCDNCMAIMSITNKDSIICKECGSRVLYKQRIDRYVEYYAR
jgi:DNA-directed RNA polymerase subunit RPC12/RpoP